jgi:hypothetical protein
MRPEKKGSGGEALGRSRGGFGTKLHVAVDALGNPVEFVLTPGQAADVSSAEDLVGEHRPEEVVADKGVPLPKTLAV